LCDLHRSIDKRKSCSESASKGYERCTFRPAKGAALSDRCLHLTSLKDLGFLDLSNTQVTNAGLEYLKSFKNCKTIRLSGTNVTDRGIPKLKQTLTGCKIT